MSINREIVEAFAAQFDPPLPVAKSLNINGKHVADGWVCAQHDAKSGLGVTAHAYEGQLHAYLEYAGTPALAERIAARMQQWVREWQALAGPVKQGSSQVEGRE